MLTVNFKAGCSDLDGPLAGKWTNRSRKRTPVRFTLMASSQGSVTAYKQPQGCLPLFFRDKIG